MLDKTRNKLINRAFQMAGITCPESMPTPNEMEDAAHALNAMLQAWNNDGFRLFKIKTAYVPLISGKSEYKLATEAYKKLSKTKILSFDRIGTTRLKIASLSGVSVGSSIEVLNNTFSESNTISDIDYKNSMVYLAKPINMSCFSGNDVFVGDNFGFAKTTVKNYASTFNAVDYSEATQTPVVGQFIFINHKNNWQKRTITNVDGITKKITFTPNIDSGNVTKSFVVFGSLLSQTSVSADAVISAREINVENLEFAPDTIQIQTSDKIGDSLNVESTEGSKIVLAEPLSDSALKQLGTPFIEAERKTSYETKALWSNFASDAIAKEDWGYVTEVPAEYADDWGFVTDPVSVSEDYGTLSGDLAITSYAKSGAGEYVIVTTEDKSFLFYKTNIEGWVDISSSISEDLSVYAKLFLDNGIVYLHDPTLGLFRFNESVASLVSSFGTEKIIKFKDVFYLVSSIAPGSVATRQVVSTVDFNTFSAPYTTVLPSVENPAEFMGKLYIGKTDTYVTSDMKVFNNINVYSDARSVIGDRLINLNTNRICSYTKDGVNFNLMPMMLSTQSSWGYKDGCSFIAIYGLVMSDGSLGTQIFTANDFNPVWTPQTTVRGKVSDITFDDDTAYFVSDMEVKSMSLIIDVISEENYAYCLGEIIGRPQEVMMITKHSFGNTNKISMNAVAIKDFMLLPRETSGTEPVSYCFLKDAIDGTLMVWGTPTKFGEYLVMLYVEPIALLGEANSTPDFPDEYYSAVEAGLAVELGYLFGLPVDRLQALEAKATVVKENAMLHDNEDLFYEFVPNERM